MGVTMPRYDNEIQTRTFKGVLGQVSVGNQSPETDYLRRANPPTNKHRKAVIQALKASPDEELSQAGG
jgi:hypothetical protein